MHKKIYFSLIMEIKEEYYLYKKTVINFMTKIV
jgi:hypothetical protein